MNKVVSMIVVALAAVGVAEAKPEMPVRPIVQVEVGVQKPMPKFKRGKRHGHKHHAHPHHYHKHSFRPIGCKGMKRPYRKPMMNASIVRPVRKVQK